MRRFRGAIALRPLNDVSSIAVKSRNEPADNDDTERQNAEFRRCCVLVMVEGCPHSVVDEAFHVRVL